MMKMQKLGAVAAFFQSAAYLSGLIFYIFVVNWAGADNPLEKVELMQAHQPGFYLITYIIYIGFGIALIALTLSVSEQIEPTSPVWSKMISAVGFIWAGLLVAAGMIFISGMNTAISLLLTDINQSEMVWTALEAAIEGVGGGNEFLGGLWTMFISIAGSQVVIFSKTFNTLGLIVGLFGLVSVIPLFAEVATAIFGLSQLVWFAWLGALLSSKKTSID